MDEQSDVKKADVSKPNVTSYSPPKKKEEKSSGVFEPKKYKNLTGFIVSIGFPGRSVTWQPFGVQELRSDEYKDTAFKRRINDFREVK